MRVSGPVIWLRARPETLALRLATAIDRPPLAAANGREDELCRVMDKRGHSYRAVATRVFTTHDEDLHGLTGKVAELWPG